MTKKKMNSYKKLGIIMLLSAIAGGILGFGGMLLVKFGNDVIMQGISAFLTGVQRAMFPILLVIAVLSVVYGEYNLKKQKTVCKSILETEEEECDRWEYEEEKFSARGMLVNILSQIFCILVLSAGYSMAYIDGNAENMLVSCGVFLFCFGYDGFWQVRQVKLVQKTYPEKKGDPASMNFQEQWLNSCDEAEKMLIYKSAYKSYSVVNKWIPALLLLAMLGQMFFNTGIFAIIVVAVIWLVNMTAYLRSCVKLRKEKIEI